MDLLQSTDWIGQRLSFASPPASNRITHDAASAADLMMMPEAHNSYKHPQNRQGGRDGSRRTTGAGAGGSGTSPGLGGNDASTIAGMYVCGCLS